MSTKEAQEKIIANMRRWQKVENASVASTGRVIEKTDNPIVRLVMELIQRDSQFHYRVQEFVADTLETKPVSLAPEELGKVWDLIEKHVEIEMETIRLAKDSLERMHGMKGLLVQQYLMEYLLLDEEKHVQVLENLRKIKQGMHPYA
ncbi:MAG: hypothetical protein NTW86_03870 [Candidatus Sumerlaeota bacterium]|nr:hypothetical protein [Candidatus Sumerlaeota bacterium]